MKIDCIHFGPCAGCTLNTPNPPPIWEMVEDFFGKNQALLPELRVGSCVEWRSKAKLAVRKGENLQIGLFQFRTHDVLPIPHCRIHHPSINQAVAIVHRQIKKLGTSIYEEATKKGTLRYIQCLVDLETKKVQLSLVVQREDQHAKKLVDALKTDPLFHSIWLNIQPEATNTILGETWILSFGSPFLEQKLAGRSFFFHPGAFSQAHWELFEALALEVLEMIPENARLFEIYSGVGVMGVLAEKKCKSVDLFENNPLAFESFKKLKIETIRYHFGDAKLAIPLLEKADCYVLDPPRKGLDPKLLFCLQREKGTIIYVSCDFRSFVRDVQALIDSGWKLKEGRGYLLFPGTDHVETVARLEKSE